MTYGSEMDFKVTKRIYPRTNNNSILEFIFEADPNLFMRKNNIQIFGKVDIPETCCPDNGFAMKLFSMLTVEVNSQLVSSNRNKYDRLHKTICFSFILETNFSWLITCTKLEIMILII